MSYTKANTPEHGHQSNDMKANGNVQPGFSDNRESTKTLGALQLMMRDAKPDSPISGGAPVQLHSYSAGTVDQVTITGSGGKQVKFNQTATNSVSYLAGEAYAQAGGSGTTTPAMWETVLRDDGTGNAATQLHIVNQEWGGSGAQAGGNIFPGSQSLNGHHKKQENAFRKLFTGGGGTTAPVAMTYTCTASGLPGNHTFVSGATGDVALSDPTVTVTVRDDTNSKILLNDPVSPGKNLKLKDPG